MPGITARLAKNNGKERKELEGIVIALAKNGDQRILAMLLDRLDGPVRQQIEQTLTQREVIHVEGVSEDDI